MIQLTHHIDRSSTKRAGLAVALVGVLLLAACSSKPKNKATPATSTVAQAAQASPVQAAQTPGTTGTPSIARPAETPTETPDDSPMARLVVPKANINAQFVTLGIIAATNVMDSPKTKDDVAYYDFSPRPGYGSNTVLSGHVDWFTGETGVFLDVKKLQKGDDIRIVLQDGKTYSYKVTDTQLYDAETAPVDEIIGDTSKESVTLITCEGTFNRAAAEYNKRRVIRGERVYQ